MSRFSDLEKKNPRINMEYNRQQIVKAILKNKNAAEVSQNPTSIYNAEL